MWDCIACGTRNIDTNNACEICGNSKEKPILTINRHRIDFGALNRAGNTTAFVQIKNTGTGILNGDISTSAPAYIRFLSPSRFSLAPSESILISIALTQNAPRPENGRQYTFSNWISISSNGGNEILGGMYSVQPAPSRFWLLWTIVTALNWWVDAFILQTYGNNGSDPIGWIIFIGATLFVGQWLLIQQKISKGGWWIGGSIIGAICAGALLWIAGSSSMLNGFVGSILIILIPSICVGVAQGLVLRGAKNSQPLWKWVLLTTLGFGIPFFIFMNSSGLAMEPTLPFLIVGVTLGIFTGIPLQRIYLEE